MVLGAPEHRGRAKQCTGTASLPSGPCNPSNIKGIDYHRVSVVTHRYNKKCKKRHLKIERPIGESNNFL